MNSNRSALALALALVGRAVSLQAAQADSFSNWPAGTSPAEIGLRVADNFIKRTLEVDQGKRQYVIYPEVINWYGALEVAKLTKDSALQQRLVQKFDPLLTAEGAKKISPDAHVDFRVFGGVPLEIYLQGKNPVYLNLGKSLADAQWAKTTPDGITAEARYWVDDIYMISLVQVQAFRATGDQRYLDRAAMTGAAYLDKLQQPNGLFFHASDSPFHWSRGNGWFAAGITELLSELPANHPQRARIMAGYKLMMAALLKYQSDDGRWRQLIDKPESWLESSGTGMFTFAMVTGVKRGWLDAATYGPAARKAWLSLVRNLDENSNVKDVCVGTNTAFNEKVTDPAAQLKYYLDRNKVTGDLHGQGPILWTAMALLR